MKAALTRESLNLLYWYGHQNFGDELSRYLVERLSAKTVRPIANCRQTAEPVLVAIGSMLHHKVMFASNVVVWGTGAYTYQSMTPNYRWFEVRQTLKMLWRQARVPAHFKAVRGPVTATLVRSKGIACPSIYGDPAILMPQVYTPTPTGPRFKGGVIVHHTQKVPEDLQQYLADRGWTCISILRDSDASLERFIDEVTQCECILSSSLHGVIIAQAYGIPARWCELEGQPIHDDAALKFEDYFLGAGQVVQKPWRMSLTCEDMARTLKEVKMPDVKTFHNTEALLEAFPK